jgi:hypothetical protein
VNGRFDQKAMVGSTWIDGPTLNHHNRHQGVILDVPQHRRCITQQLSRYNRTNQTPGFHFTNLGTDPGVLMRVVHDQRRQIIGLAAYGDTAVPPCLSLQLPLAYKYTLLQPPTQRAI